MLLPGRQTPTPPAVPARSEAPAKPAFGGFRGLSVPQVAAVPRRPTALVSTTAIPVPVTGRPTLALPVGKSPFAGAVPGSALAPDTKGGVRGLPVPGASQYSDLGGVVSGGIKGMTAPMPKAASADIRTRLEPEAGMKADAQGNDRTQQGRRPRFAPGGVRAESTSSPRFAPGGVRAD